MARLNKLESVQTESVSAKKWAMVITITNDEENRRVPLLRDYGQLVDRPTRRQTNS